MARREPPSKPGGGATPEASPANDEAGPDFPVHEYIGRQLRAMFDEILTEPVPEKLLKLIEELDKKGSKD